MIDVGEAHLVFYARNTVAALKLLWALFLGIRLLTEPSTDGSTQEVPTDGTKEIQIAIAEWLNCKIKLDLNLACPNPTLCVGEDILDQAIEEGKLDRNELDRRNSWTEGGVQTVVYVHGPSGIRFHTEARTA